MLLINAANKLSKVTGYIKDGQIVIEIYNTEKRILRKVRTLSSNANSDFSSNNSAQIRNTILETTGQLVDKAIQVVSDDIFSLSDFQRESVFRRYSNKIKRN